MRGHAGLHHRPLAARHERTFLLVGLERFWHSQTRRRPAREGSDVTHPKRLVPAPRPSSDVHNHEDE